MRFKKPLWVMLVLTILTIFINLGDIPLLDPDEPVYGETPKEMIMFNDYISPRIYGEFWYDKPPMYYWLVAGAYKLLGINEFATRVPSALLAVICVSVVYYMTAKLFDQRTGIISGVVLATSLEFFYLAKAAVTDMTLTLFLTVSLFCFFRRKYYMFYLFSGLATLTKGPIGLFPGIIVIIWLAVTHRFAEIRRMKLIQGIMVWLLVVMPWYGAMYAIHGMDFINGFIGINNILRFATPEHVETAGWYFFIPVLLLGFFPWSSLLIPAITAAVKARTTANHGILSFLLVWAAFIFLFFSISSTKLVTYILPMFPALAVIVGWYISSCWEDWRLTGQRLIWPIVLTIVALLLIGAIIKGSTLIPGVATGGLVGLAIVLGMMPILVWWFLSRRNVEKAFWGQALMMVAVSVLLFNIILPPVAAGLHTREIARQFVSIYDGKTPVYIMKFMRPGFAFYANMYGLEMRTDKDISSVIATTDTAYLIIQQSDYQLLSNAEKGQLTLVTYLNDKLILLKR